MENQVKETIFVIKYDEFGIGYVIQDFNAEVLNNI